MRKSQAHRLMKDLEKNLIDEDYCEDIYISTKSAGTKSFRNCSYFEVDNYIFIWTKEQSLLISSKEVGDYIIIPHKKDNIITLKQVI